jgi:hypothetical protein
VRATPRTLVFVAILLPFIKLALVLRVCSDSVISVERVSELASFVGAIDLDDVVVL